MMRCVVRKRGIPTANCPIVCDSVLSRELPGDVISQFRAVACSVHRAVTAVTGCTVHNVCHGAGVSAVDSSVDTVNASGTD